MFKTMKGVNKISAVEFYSFAEWTVTGPGAKPEGKDEN